MEVQPQTMFKIMFYGCFFALVILFRGTLIDVVVHRFDFDGEIEPPTQNAYTVPKEMANFISINYTNNFIADDYETLRNIVFMAINSGVRSYTFYCAREYENCFVDLDRIANDRRRLSYYNNFVHPYNSFENLRINWDTQRKITLSISRLYTPSEIEELNKAVEKIWNNVISDGMSERQKIRAIHDGILNNSVYDRARADEIIGGADYFTDNPSHKATGPLLHGQAICGGYSDAMSIFLFKMGIDNYRISNEKHIWNFLKLGDNWYHLDLTWNNPSVAGGDSIIIETYFLISTRELRVIGDDAHNYDDRIFVEAK